VATARGLALAHGATLVGVGTLRALAEPVTARSTAAVLDARRGEAFIGLYRDGEELLAPRVCGPAELAGLALRGGPETLAIGDGALRFRELIERAGVHVAPAESHLHRVSAAAICRLAAEGKVTSAVPDYLRLADAELALVAKTR
jgi:tRNA threonylcarbamoyladenosine biosynthesis protein TsaB